MTIIFSKYASVSVLLKIKPALRQFTFADVHFVLLFFILSFIIVLMVATRCGSGNAVNAPPLYTYIRPSIVQSGNIAET